MTDSFAIWRPEHDGHAPPNWREGMKWTGWSDGRYFNDRGKPDWLAGDEYYVEPEALNSPNDDASGDVDTWKQDDAVRDMSTCNKCGRRYHSAPIGFIHKCSCSGGMMVRDSDATAGQKIIGALEEAIAMVRAASPETLQKHGITLAPEKDVFVELFRDARKAFLVARYYGDGEKDAAAILRTRFEQMIAERSKRDA